MDSRLFTIVVMVIDKCSYNAHKVACWAREKDRNDKSHNYVVLVINIFDRSRSLRFRCPRDFYVLRVRRMFTRGALFSLVRAE